MAELQKELADDQSDYAVDAQKEALDDMQTAYENEKDAEIKALEETISSYQKLYDMAIAYIEEHWNTLYDELIAWNTEYGSVLNSEITTAWENCLAAAQRYGSYVSALNNIDADIAASTSGGTTSTGGTTNNRVVGTTGNHSSSSSEDSIHAIIKEMYANSQEHHTATQERKKWLDNRNLQLGTMLSQMASRPTVTTALGIWTVPVNCSTISTASTSTTKAALLATTPPSSRMKSWQCSKRARLCWTRSVKRGCIGWLTL